MTILITGGAGYIGSIVARYCVENGLSVVVLDNLQTGHRDAVGSDIQFVLGDIADQHTVRKVIRDYHCSQVIHFAARSLVGESMTFPLKYFRDNAEKTWRFFEVLLDEQVTQLVFSSTAAVYGTPTHVPIAETHALAPLNPYGQSKRMIEDSLFALERSHGLRSVMLRYFNAAGAWPERRLGERHVPETHLIPIMLDVAAQNRPSLLVYGADYPTYDGSCIRDYIHVRDLASAHVAALEYLKNDGVSRCMNLGTQLGVSVFEMIACVERVTGAHVPYVVAERRAGDPPELVANAQLAKELLDWTPQYSSLERIVRDAYSFYCRG